MSLLPQNQSGNTQAQNERRRKLAQSLLEQNQQAPQGQMVGGVFVAPSWTQYLAKGLNQYNARKEMSNADKSDMDLQRKKNEAIAALLKPAEQTGENPLETRLPAQIENEKRMKVYQAVSEFGLDPSLQLALEDMNYQRNRGDKRADIQDERGYQGTIRAEDRGNKLADVADQRAYEDVVRKENQGFQLTQQERGFKQQFEMQKQSQGFQAGQNALNRNFQAGQNQLSREQQLGIAALKNPVSTPQAKINDATDVLQILKQAAPLVNKSTGSGVGNLIDESAAFFGKTTGGAQAAAQLKALEGTLISKMPKMSGPQSDKDVLLYKQMAGQIGDPRIPPAQKQAAMDTINELNSRYAGVPVTPLNYNPNVQPSQSFGDIPTQDAIAAELQRRRGGK